MNSRHYDDRTTDKICDMFTSIVQDGYGDNVAVEHGIERLSYNELDVQSDRVATILLHYAPGETIIGVSSVRSVDMVVFVLGVLKAGKIYLPLDPTHPTERLQQIVVDSGIRHIACSDKDFSLFSRLGLQRVPDVEDIKSTSLKPAPATRGGYILYTSGSTGKPKGVHMAERALVNLIKWQRTHSIATIGTKTLQFAPLTFDVSFQEIFATLTTAGTLVMVDDELRLNPTALLTFIDEQNVNRLFLPFVALQLLADAAGFSGVHPRCLQEVITAGEQLKVTPQIIRFFGELPSTVLFNQYGPTEAHVVSSLKLDGPASLWPELPTIGTPIDNVDLLILNEDRQPVENGEIGELYVAGVCLAEGYFNDPALTSERFIEWTH